MLKGVAVAVAVLVLATACADDEPTTITVAGQPVPVASLVDAHAALCEAAAAPDAARRLFFDRSHEQLHTVARGLEDVDRAEAARLLQAKEKVESELPSPPASLPDDLRTLAAVYRDGLGRLAITAPPCDK